MRLKERRGAASREFRARFKEVKGEVRLVVDDALMGPRVLSPVDARLYNLFEASPQEQERARQLGFYFVLFEEPIIVLDETGTEHTGEIHAWKSGGGLYVDGARVLPAEARRYFFKAITTDQREELRAYGYSVPESLEPKKL